MLYRREGMPEEDELVLCTVTNVHHHSVFAKLDEYDKTGMIHISEVSPGRIRNLRDYVQEGKKVVCKILRIDKVKGHIDLSLRRVNEGQKRKKMDQIKREQKAEKIVENLANKLKKETKSLYEEISSNVFKKYEYLFECFEDVVADKVNLEKLGFDKKLAKELTELIKEKIKPQEVQIKGKLNLTSYASDGVEIIRQALKKAEDAGKENVELKYAGGGAYSIVVKSPDYKTAEKILEKCTEAAIKFIEKNEGIASFDRIEA
jgi:translation initiation factor 2 subunit 1